ncbi:MAG: DUF3108 domain-containing protein [Gallionella sp.]
MKWITQLLICFVLSPAAYAAPGKVQASYDIFMSGIKIGHMVETYRQQDHHYTLSSTTTPIGLAALFRPGNIISHSRGLIDKQGLRPQHFDYKNEANANKDSQAEFNWETQQLTLTHRSASRRLPLPEGTQDRLSAMYQFMFLPLKNMTTLNFMMTNGSKLDKYHYAISTHTKLNTPTGQCNGLYLDSQAKLGESRTEIWLSAEYQLPCKMIITDKKGVQLTQILNGLHITP